MKSRQNQLQISVMIITASLILFWGTAFPRTYAFDDAYITYRYAANFSKGLGLTYNPEQWVLGTTTPLFTLLLGALGLVTSDFELLGRWLSMISWVAASWFAILLFRRIQRPKAGLVAGVLVAVQPSILASLGMETALVVALMLAVAWSWYSDRRLLTGLLMAALLLTRLDSALWLLLLALEKWRERERPPWLESMLAASLLFPWLGYAQWRYGSFLPNSITAKIGQTDLMPVGGQGTFLQNYFNSITSGLSTLMIAVLLLQLVVGVIIIAWRERRLWWLIAWPVLYFAVYTWLGTATFPWYYTPPATILGLITAMGIGSLFGDDDILPSYPEKQTVARIGRISLAALLLLFILVFQWNRTQSVLNRKSPGYQSAYRPAGLWLAQNTPPGSVVASIEIGVIGYFSERSILDTMGLVSPEMTGHLLGWLETLAYSTAVYWPDYIVTLTNTAWEWLIPQWWFSESYAPVVSFDNVTVYQLTSQPEFTHSVNQSAQFVGDINLTEVRLSRRQLEPGTTLDLQIQLETLAKQEVGYLLTFYLVDTATEERLALTSMEPFEGAYPLDVWQPGDDIAIPARLEIPGNLEAGTYRLGVLLYDPARGQSVPLSHSPDASFTELQVGWLRSGDPPAASIDPSLRSIELLTRWQAGIELVAIDLPNTHLAAGDTLPVHLTWRSTETTTRDLKVFVHLIDDLGTIISQQDQRPFGGRFPTPSWQPGETLRDLYQLTLPEDISNGSYGLRIGFYDHEGRLGLVGESDDSLELANILQIWNP